MNKIHPAITAGLTGPLANLRLQGLPVKGFTAYQETKKTNTHPRGGVVDLPLLRVTGKPTHKPLCAGKHPCFFHPLRDRDCPAKAGHRPLRIPFSEDSQTFGRRRSFINWLFMPGIVIYPHTNLCVGV